MEAWKQKAKNDLETIISNLSLKEYARANFKNGKKSKKHTPYSLTDEILQALKLSKSITNEQMTIEQENDIKAFLIPFRMNTREDLYNRIKTA